MKIVLSGIYYPVAILRYFEAALDRLVESSEHAVEVFKVGHFTGTNIPWNGGMHLRPEYAGAPHMPLPTTGNIPFTAVEQYLPWEPDLWLQIVSTNWFTGRPVHGQVFSIGVDPHCVDYSAPRTNSDRFFCMQTPYMVDGDIWLPYAYDPVWHAPPSPNGETPTKVYDAALVGAAYPHRTALVDALRQRGYSVFYQMGPAYLEARAIYHQAKIGLNWSSLQDTTARCFEVMAMGCAGVFNQVPDLLDMFSDGNDFLGFRDLDDAVEQVELLLSDDHIRSNIAMAGHAVVQGHTYDNRLGVVLEYV